MTFRPPRSSARVGPSIGSAPSLRLAERLRLSAGPRQGWAIGGDERFLPESERLRTDDWIGTSEEIDELTVFDQARALKENLPTIRMTYLASNEPLPDPKEDAAWRKLLGGFVDRFTPGRLIYVDAPHYMNPRSPSASPASSSA